jgi:di/tricarboxylate transporter
MLTTPELIVLFTGGMALLLILSGRIRADVIALLVLLTLAFTGVVTSEQVLSGFSNPAIISIISMFFISNGLEDTGVVQRVANWLGRFGGQRDWQLVLLAVASGAIVSLVMNNIAAAAVMFPIVTTIALEAGASPSRMLMPLAIGTSLGGMATYFTTANIVISGVLIQQGLRGLTLLDFILAGGLVALVGIAYMVLIGRRQLPVREGTVSSVPPTVLSRTLYQTYQLDERLWEVRVLDGSWLIGTSLGDARIGSDLGLTVLAIWRGHQAMLNPPPDEVIERDDYLLILGREDRVVLMSDWGVKIGRSQDDDPTRPSGALGTGHRYSVDLTEVVIPPRSSIIGSTLQKMNFRSKYGITSVALWRGGRSYRTDVGKMPLEVGDALLMVGAPERIRALARDRDFIVLQSSHAARPRHPGRGWLAALITLVALGLALAEVVATAEALLAAAVAMVLTGCINLDEAYRAVEWRVVFIIAGLLPLSTALISTGLAERLGDLIGGVLGTYGDLALVGGTALITIAVTQVLSGQVAGLVMAPIGVSLALQLGVNPQAMGVALAIACGITFLTPTAHGVNVLLMGPGGYKAGDFARVGVGLTVVCFIAMLLAMAWFWGIR